MPTKSTQFEAAPSAAGYAGVQPSPLRWFAATLAYAAVIVYGSLVPLDYQPLSWEESFNRFRELRDLNLTLGHRADWLANLFLYAPLGFMATLAGCGLSRWIAWRVFAALLVVVGSTGLAFATEFVQLWFPPRTVSQNDLRAEAIGAGVGVLAGLVTALGGAAIWRRLDPLLRSLLPRWGGAYLAALLLYSLMPGDLVVSGEEFAAKLRAGRVNLIPLASMELSVDAFLKRSLHVLCFAPIGWLAARGRFRQPNTPSLAARPLWKTAAWSALAGAGLAALIELLQLPIYSRETSTIALAYGFLGAMLGGAARHTAAGPRRPVWLQGLVRAAGGRALWRAAVVLYAAAVPALLLAPFEFIGDAAVRAERWEGLFRVPFAALYVSSEFEALTNVLQKGGVFGVLGALIYAGWPESKAGIGARGAGLLGVLAFAALLGGAIEVAQVFVASHQPDGTDVLIYAAFSAIGYKAAAIARAAATSPTTNPRRLSPL